ncbi:MAG: hypothetical protein M3N68_14585 [Actinomycetota bacterium]|nr:hypothetical protein [Actinomycetota bacterium]
MTTSRTSSLDFEREQRRRKDVEDRDARRTRLTVLAIAIPLGVIALALVAGAFNEREQDKMDFQLRAAQAVMNERGDATPASRARALKSLFGDGLPDDFADHFDPETYGNADVEAQVVRSKKDLMQLLADHPRERAQIIDTWKQVFPGDKWVDDLR